MYQQTTILIGRKTESEECDKFIEISDSKKLAEIQRKLQEKLDANGKNVYETAATILRYRDDFIYQYKNATVIMGLGRPDLRASPIQISLNITAQNLGNLVSDLLEPITPSSSDIVYGALALLGTNSKTKQKSLEIERYKLSEEFDGLKISVAEKIVFDAALIPNCAPVVTLWNKSGWEGDLEQLV